MPATASNNFFKQVRHFAEIKKEILSKYLRIWCKQNLTITNAGAQDKPFLFLDLNPDTLDTGDNQSQVSLAHYREYFGIPGKREQLNELLQIFYFEEKPVFAAIPVEEDASPEVAPAYTFASLGEEVNQTVLAELLQAGCPSLAFINPFDGNETKQPYLQQISESGTEVIMLFSSKEIVKAVTGKKINPSLAAFFGDRLAQMQHFFKSEKNTSRRQECILNHLTAVLEAQNYFTLRFHIYPISPEDPGYHLLFATANKIAYRSFKEMLLPYSMYQSDGVPLFTTHLNPQQQQLTLFPKQQKYAIPKLVEELASCSVEYKYKSIEKIFEEHSAGTPYCRENYLIAYDELRNQGKVEILNPKTLQAIRKATFASIVKYK